MTAHLFVCETCGYDEKAPDARRKGDMLAELIEQQALQLKSHAVEIHRTRCLMACKHHCSVNLQEQGKIGYVMGDFSPDAEAASTILDYSIKYQQSETGQVNYAQWPEAIKGKFIARIPTLEAIDS
jgi:predicted metal-binding protein